MADGFFIIVVLLVLAGLAYRILSLGSAGARCGFLPDAWQRWLLNGSSNPNPRR
jgi:hypothetical protein